MSSAKKLNLVSVKDYLAAELDTPIKHEYVDGHVYAKADERNLHNHIVGNTTGALHVRLRGRPCQPFNSSTKIRIRFPGHYRFYYADALVTCRPNPPNDHFQDEPAVVFEVLSRHTHRIDHGEKNDAYQTIPSLKVYVLIEQEMPAAVAYRRTKDGFVREVYQGLDAVVPLGEIGVDLPLADIYENVGFVAEPDSDADGQQGAY